MSNREILLRGKVEKEVLKELVELELFDPEGIVQEGWVYGNLIWNGGHPYIVGDIADWGDEYIAHEWWMSVSPETVGQFTGLCDKEGVKIFEGDILEIDLGLPVTLDKKGRVIESRKEVTRKALFVVGYEKCSFTLKAIQGSCKEVKLGRLPHIMEGLVGHGEPCYVVGNIHDNPGFLEGL